MERREFLRTVALAGLASTFKFSDAMDILAQSGKNVKTGAAYDLVAVMGGEPEMMFRKAITEMGGMSKFVKPGNKVVVKPNIGWDKVPELAGNTNPKLVKEIIAQCYKAGAAEVIVFDHTCDDWRKCYKNSGIEDAAKAAKAKVVPANEESYYREVDLPHGKNLRKTKIHNAILDCDVWINVPILKHHGGANLTISMKNHMGICTFRKPAVLNVVDAYRVLKSNGPRGTSAADVVNPKALFISSDIVAVDTAATKFFNQIRTMPLEDVGHLAKGEALNIGTMNLDDLKVRRLKM